MIEKPQDRSITVDDTAEFYRALVLSGLPITQMNALRKHFSQVKGGRLAVEAQGATQCGPTTTEQQKRLKRREWSSTTDRLRRTDTRATHHGQERRSPLKGRIHLRRLVFST
jgi:Domain of unknown function (DUF4147)